MQFLNKLPLYKYTLLLLGSFSMIFFTTPGHTADKKDPLSIWPKAEAGYKRIVIELPTLKNEDSHRVELIPEKEMKVDCNHVMINGEMQTKPLQGWGYEYYVLSKVSEPASTLMACINNVTQTKQIPITTNLHTLRYNSKLPIVVYIPNNINLSYRIWSAGPLQKNK